MKGQFWVARNKTSQKIGACTIATVSLVWSHKQPTPTKGKTMNIMQALEILKTWINLDATLTGEAVNLNRVSFMLSEMTYGKMHVGANWHHVVPAHRNSDGTVRRDIHQLASEIAYNHNYGARELVEMVARPLTLTKTP